MWGGASGHTDTFMRQLDGMTDIDVYEGKNVKGRIVGFVLRTIGKGVLEKTFTNSVKASRPGTTLRESKPFILNPAV